MTASAQAATTAVVDRRRISDLPWGRVVGGSVKWIGMYVAALVIFGAFAATRGVDPWAMYRSMWDATIASSFGRGQVFDKAAPFVLAALAVAVPARAGLVNIGGEGQIVIGATAAGGVSLALAGHVSGVPMLLLMGLAGILGGAAWAGIAALLRVFVNVNEAISTLLLNYVGADVLAFLVYGAWKDASGNGQPASKPLPLNDQLPTWSLLNAHIGIVIALVATVAVALVLRRTRWGFSLRAVGGNPEAARRAGLPVRTLLISAMLVGGALAGLGGAVHYAGLETQLRPGIAATFGYTGFLAAWLGRHNPSRVAVAAIAVAVVSVAGGALQISSDLPGSAVNILLALVLLAALAYRPAIWKAAS